PRMQQLNADLGGLRKQLTGEISKLVESLEKEAKVAQGREDSIKKSLDEIKTRVVSNAPDEAKLRQLEANAKAKRVELENLQNQLESNRKRQDTRAQPVEAQIITKAQAASVPVFPKKGQNAALIAFATLLFGTFWTITRALFNGARGGARAALPAVAKEVSALRAEPTLAVTPAARAQAKAAAVPAKAAAPAPVAQDEDATTIASMAERLRTAAPAQGGHRSMVTGETAAIDAGAEAIALAKALSASGAHVMLIDWSPSGKGIAAEAGVEAAKGLTELVLGTASFEDAVQRLPGSNVHFIACGAPFAETDDIDPDQLNLVLDALDEAYDHIIVTGQHEDSRALFEAIQGRFDAGIMVHDSKKRVSVLQDPPGTFLGFEVSEIDIIRLARVVVSAVPAQRILRATRKAMDEAQPVV
ncbi:MAG: lipopolysaccharide biosynthesis protein, partial [Hyphomicrobium sp.]